MGGDKQRNREKENGKERHEVVGEEVRNEERFIKERKVENVSRECKRWEQKKKKCEK